MRKKKTWRLMMKRILAAHKTNSPILLIGVPGSGKTQFLEAFVAKLGKTITNKTVQGDQKC